MSLCAVSNKLHLLLLPFDVSLHVFPLRTFFNSLHKTDAGAGDQQRGFSLSQDGPPYRKTKTKTKYFTLIGLGPVRESSTVNIPLQY